MVHIFEPIINFICKQSLRRPLIWLTASILISIPAVLQFSRLGLDTDLIRLLPEDSKAAQQKKQVDQIAEGSGGFFAILLESQDKTKLTSAFQSTVEKVKNLDGVGNLEYQHPVEFYQKFRYVLVPSEFLDRILDFFIRLEARVNPMGEDLFSDNEEPTEKKEEKEQEDKDEIKKMMRYLDLPHYHQSEDGQVMAIKIFPQKGSTSLGKMKRLFNRLEKLTNEITQEYKIWGGVGGSWRNSINQYDFIIADLGRSGTITFITVILALCIGFGSIRILPVLLYPLALGLIWTMGSIPILVGDLNTITSFLLLVSFGLGIDFSIHLVKRFQTELQHHSMEEALYISFQSTGKSILVSGLTTAIALFILAFSQFRGFSEFGIIGGYSMLMIILAMILFLPAICILGFKIGLIKKSPPKHPLYIRAPKAVGTIIILLIIGTSAILGWQDLRFNFDFSKMDVEVAQEQQIKQRFYKVYESVRSPDALFIAHGLDHLDQLNSILKKEVDNNTESSRIQRFHSIRELCPDNTEFQKRLDLIAQIKEAISGRWIDRVEDLDYKKWIDDMRSWNPPDSHPQVEELPQNVRQRFSSKSHPNYYIIPIYIKGDKQKGHNAIAFTDQLNQLPVPERTIGPFGETTVLADVLKIVTKEGPWMVLLSLLGIFLLILLNQRSLTETLWMMVPLSTGMILTVGIMIAAGLTLNFFNIVVFPTLIGMGVDDGIHYYRRWQELKGDIMATQKELFVPLSLTSITTIFGYVGIAFSRHPGLQSIGILACIALFSTWFTSLFLLPGLLGMISRHREKKQQT